MTDFETKDSGQHEEYDSGMRRDSQAGKPRFDLIRTKAQPYGEQMIYRYAMLLARGAEKYADRNWEEGDSEVELERAKASLLRHTEQLVAGETDEDHAAAVWFNAQAIEYFRWRIDQKVQQEAQAEMKPSSIQGQGHITILPGGMVFRGSSNHASGTALDSDKVDWQRTINAWHNRPEHSEYSKWRGVVAEPPATPEDRIRARVNVAAALGRLQPRAIRLPRRVGEWLAYYGAELVEGDMDNMHEKIDIVEFDQRLKQDGIIIRKSPVDDAPSFD